LESDNLRITSGATQPQARSRGSPQHIYLLRLQSGADIRPLRGLLKFLLRRFGMRCLSVSEEARP
jgi:hypothetical protein